MRTWLLALATTALIACGGDDGTGTDLGDTDGTDPVSVDLCDGIPTFDLSGQTCDGIRSSYDQTIAAANRCDTVDDCQSLSARCDVNLTGGCFAIVNDCIDQGDVDEFADAWVSCDDDPRSGCPQGGCLPPDFMCDQGVCVIVLTTPTY